MRNDLERERDVPRRRSEATLTMGIEEEFFIVEQETGRLAHGGWQGLADDLLGSVDVTPEIYREMIEARTRVHVALQPLLDEQQFNRRTLVTHLRPHSKCLLACGTHPLDSWQNTTIEDKERYRQLIGGYGTCLERALTCGMHVHFGFNKPALMMAAYAFIRAYLPVIAAISAASPFWQGRNTRLQSYRRSVFDALPRSGLPPRIASLAEYTQFCQALEDPRYLSNATTVWWDARLNVKHGTLEIRVPDTVPQLRRAQAITIFAALCVDQALSSAPIEMSDVLIQENRWRATKFGIRARLFCGNVAQQQIASDCVDAILERGRMSTLMSDCNWTIDEVRAALLEMGDTVDDYNDDDHFAARRYLETALQQTAACGQDVQVKKVA
jgi:carboxylate-amine ligase